MGRREGWPGREEKEEGKAWHVAVSLGDSSVARGKQEVAMELARDSHAAAPWDSMKKIVPLCKEPLALQVF
jgi:hypothetical protein